MRLVLLYYDEPELHAPAVYHTMLLMVSDKSEIKEQEQSITQTLSALSVKDLKKQKTNNRNRLTISIMLFGEFSTQFKKFFAPT